jgi:hypothetical protein
MDFLDLIKNNEKFDTKLLDFEFISKGHIRYKNGQDVSGHNYDCWRGIRIQNNTSGGQGYIVTIYNLDGSNPVWGNNIQMAPKQMKIIEQNKSSIKLRGYGTDQMGNPFADYGLTLHLENKIIDKITLHLHDRNIDISYFIEIDKSSNKPQYESNPANQSTPTSNFTEVMALGEIMDNCVDIFALNTFYAQKSNYPHPYISNKFGVKFLIRGDKATGKKALIQGASYGIQYPCQLYSNSFVDSIGQCFALLMTQYPIVDYAKAMKATALGYIYLSRCIEMYPNSAYDSYRTRALLFKDHENPMVVEHLIMENLGIGILVEPFIISDFYFTSKLVGNPHQDAIQCAKRIHYSLEDIAVGGKDADEYSLQEIAELGGRRHHSLFKALETKYKNGEYNLGANELNNAIR